MAYNEITALWNDIRTLMQDVEADVYKNSEGNAAAGVRARAALRRIRALSSTLVKASTTTDKAARAARLAAKGGTSAPPDNFIDDDSGEHIQGRDARPKSRGGVRAL